MIRSIPFPVVLLLATLAPARAESVPDFTPEGAVIEVVEGAEQALELEDCLAIALEGNAALRQEREGLARLQARKVQARAEGFPRVELQGAFSRSRDPSFALDESFGGGEDIVIPGLPDDFSFLPSPEDVPAQSFWRTYVDGYWELRPTRVWRAVRAAKGAIEQQEAGVLDREHRTAEAVISAYHEVVLAHERLLATEREVEARRETLAITRRRWALDLSTPLDTLQAAVSLANLMPEQRRRVFDLRQAGQRLNLLLGREPLSELSVVARFPLEEGEVDRRRALELAASRPDLEAERRSRDLYELQRGVASADNHPYLTVEGQWGFVGRDLGTLTDEGHDFWRTGVTLHLPLFDGLVTKGRIREAEAEIRRTEHRIAEFEAQVRDEVLGALDALEIARADLAAAQLNMQRAEDAFAQVRLRYELGKSDNLSVLNAQSERSTARSVLIEARYRVLGSVATLKRAMGVSPLVPLATLISSPPLQENPR